MGLFDLFKKKEIPPPLMKVPQDVSPKFHVDLPKEEPVRHAVFTNEQIQAIVWPYIDKNGIKGLSKEEAELAKAFFADIFIHFHENAKTNTSTHCTQSDCELSNDEPVFVSGSGRVFCKDCALRYVISNLSDWHYYLGNIVSGIGPVPLSIQNKGLALQKTITEQRDAARLTAMAVISDQREFHKIVMDSSVDIDTRIMAMGKINDIQLLTDIAVNCDSPRFRKEALSFPISQEMIAKLAKDDSNYNVREAALKKLESQEVLEYIAFHDEKRDLRNLAVSRLTNRKVLETIMDNDPIEYVRDRAKDRLSEIS